MVIFKSRVCVVHTVPLDFDFRGEWAGKSETYYCLKGLPHLNSHNNYTHYNNISKWWVDDILTLLFVAPVVMGHHISGCLKTGLSGYDEIILQRKMTVMAMVRDRMESLRGRYVGGARPSPSLSLQWWHLISGISSFGTLQCH
jgi:hypothetical protein